MPSTFQPPQRRAASAFRWYHVLVTLLILLSGIACISFGVYLIFRDPLRAFSFNISSDRNLQLFFSMTYMSLAAGIILCLVALCAAVADLRTNRLILSLYIAILLVVIVMLIFTAVVSFCIVRWTRTRPTRIVSVLRQSWVASVAEHGDVVCAIQARYNCYGFDDDVCVGCWAVHNDGGLPTCPDVAQYKNRSDQCPFCADATTPSVTVGCYSAFVKVAAPLYMTVGAAASAVAALLVVDVPVVICL